MKKSNNIYVIKASGKREPFSEKKLRRSIHRARIPHEMEDQVINHVHSIIYQDIPTSEIYQHIVEFIGKSNTPYHRASYALKNAIMDLGPSGYPFEKFIAAVLNHYGFQTKTNLILKGKCVDHEIDVVAQKNEKYYLLECKFHNQPGTRSDIKVVLYTQARFLDLQTGSAASQEFPNFDQAWIVTNTKATTQAIAYAKCVNMRIIGWSYPRIGNLQELIEDKNLQPITCLSSLNNEQKKLILNLGVVLCQDLLEDERDLVKSTGLSQEQSSITRAEIEAIFSQ